MRKTSRAMKPTRLSTTSKLSALIWKHDLAQRHPPRRSAHLPPQISRPAQPHPQPPQETMNTTTKTPLAKYRSPDGTYPEAPLDLAKRLGTHPQYLLARLQTPEERLFLLTLVNNQSKKPLPTWVLEALAMKPLVRLASASQVNAQPLQPQNPPAPGS